MSYVDGLVDPIPTGSHSLHLSEVDTQQELEVLADARRTVTLTDKGKGLYQTGMKTYYSNVEAAWKNLESLLKTCQSKEKQILLLREREKQLSHLHGKYRHAKGDFIAFLQRNKTAESDTEYAAFTAIDTPREKRVQVTFQLIDTNIQEIRETVSQNGTHSNHNNSSKSHSSSGSSPSVLARKQAKADAARARVEFAAKENDLRKQQAMVEAENQRKTAELAADLDLLRIQADAAAAEAEVQALHSVDGKSEPSRHSHVVVSQLPEQPSLHKTSEYVTQIDSHCTGRLDQTHRKQIASSPVFRKTEPTYHEFPIETPGRTHEIHPQITTDLTRFLLKKELLLSRLTHFSDRPESYAVWKAGFVNIMEELQVTPVEEFDLLVKWLGPESSRHALSLRASNVNNPSRGLARVWERLDERFGSPEMVESALKHKLENFPRLTNKDNRKLFELSDIVSEIESLKEDPRYSQLLGYFDSSSGVKPIMEKLPFSLQDRWISQAISYKRLYGVAFPPFTLFAEFMREQSRAKNDPSFVRDIEEFHPKKDSLHTRKQPNVSARKTDVCDTKSENKCPLHKVSHTLNQCKAFRAKPIRERKDLLKKFGLCYRCCASYSHLANACNETINCSLCNSNTHPTALHADFKERTDQTSKSTSFHGGEERNMYSPTMPASHCTQVCGNGLWGKSCAKTVLVTVYPEDRPGMAVRTYAVIDDQSNVSLVRAELLDQLNIHTQSFPYTLSSCAGVIKTSGRRASGLAVKAVSENAEFSLPTLIECDNIPNQRDEIPTPQVAEHYPHLRDLYNHIPPVDDKADILLLIGRDLPEVHHVKDQRIGPKNSPFAQKLSLGWVIIGQACLGGIHQPKSVNVLKTSILSNGRPTLCEPCPNKFNVKEDVSPVHTSLDLGASVFQSTSQDEKPGMSVEDTDFLKIMDTEFCKSPDGNWIAPLPFRSERRRLPNNRPQAVRRAYILDRSLRRNEEKKKHFVAFMKRLFDNRHVELAPPLETDEECWYLPLFGVYHPQKKDQIRGVFDASAQYEGISLNNVLLTGPDLTNNLLGILLRFRKESVAITADIEQMFYCFYVRPDHRNFLRFFWYQDNDTDKPLVEYHMCVHVFGNSSSPAIATYGLRKTAADGENTFGKDTQEFVDKDFYVDDGITSLPTCEGAIDLLKRPRQSLKTYGNLRLHKIASNSVDVMDAFPSTELEKGFRDLDLGSDHLPMQRSLGLSWDLNFDTFTFKASSSDKPYTRRGILSSVNSLYDPLGFVAPVSLKGKLLLREVITQTKDWDEPLSPELEQGWEEWKEYVKTLQDLHIPRPYTSTSLENIPEKEIHIFCDASEKAIAAVAYLKTTTENDFYAFVLGKARVSPLHAQTIPRLELCAAVLAVEISEVISEHLNLQPAKVRFFTDSKIVLGYISNDSRRFCVYVANRVSRIRRSTKPEQWSFVPTDSNPADIATRATMHTEIAVNGWLQGPPAKRPFSEVEAEDPTQTCPHFAELEDQVVTLSTSTSPPSGLGSSRFERFSTWKGLTRALVSLKHICQSFKGESCQAGHGWHVSPNCRDVTARQEAEHCLIRTVQQEEYAKELSTISTKGPFPKNSPLLDLNPFLDKDGLLRVGGRLGNADLTELDKHPIIIPGRSHAALLLVRHYHEETRHQGRHFTEGAIRSAGYWITGGKRIVSSVIHKCVRCRKLRGKQAIQKMGNLPADRLQPAPPFSYVGVDTFGPWNVVTRKTRGGGSNSKRWAILFTCLSTRAVHLEAVEEMSSSSLINAVRRFISIRGSVTEFRSDRGTNFVGATDSLQIDAINVESGSTKDFLYNKGITWVFNPPHSSHMGGVWERMIGVSRRILDSILMDISGRNLTHEVLTTFLAEVSAIINARPIVPVSTDPESPTILSPSQLLTLKSSKTVEPLRDWSVKDLYKAQWKRVQTMADTFWKRWQGEYLNTLQRRQKWKLDCPNVCQGDIVLLKDKDVRRNEWPVAIVVRPLPGTDGKVRKAEIRTIKEGKATVYTRPIKDMIPLLSP